MPSRIICATFILLAWLISGCKKLVEVNPPLTSVSTTNVFTDNGTAISAVTAMYTRMSESNLAFINFPTYSSTSLFHGLAADELTLHNPADLKLGPYYRNALSAAYSGTESSWSRYYSMIFLANSALEGLENATLLDSRVKQQLLGESRLVRAFVYFYLVNIYGDVPLILSTDYSTNINVPRTPAAQVYEQIITDLKAARDILSPRFPDSDLISASEERVRPNKWAAAAMLARVYLYTGDYANAEAEASAVIENNTLFDIASVSLNDVFLKNSKETIWALQPVGTNISSNTGEGRLFVLPPSGPDLFQFPVYLSGRLTSAFESGDRRKVYWTDTVETRDNLGTLMSVYSFPYKYKIGGGVNTFTQEYVVVLRMAEQYLIRAEARAEQGRLVEAAQDVDVLRHRAGLPELVVADQNAMLAAILHERQVELFTEWGHRWFDLKRKNFLDNVMPQVAIEKGGTWESFRSLEPIPASELDVSPGMNGSQNPGY